MNIMTTKDLSVSANSKSANIYEGKQGRFITRPSIVRVAACGSATGLRLTLSVGAYTVVDDQDISDINRFPQIPEDVLARFATRGGELFGNLRNTTGGALTAEILTEVEEVV
jgi:hypothetical protein